MDDDVIARGEELSVLGMEIRVMALEDVMATKLMAITEHSLRYEGLLQIARRCASRSMGDRPPGPRSRRSHEPSSCCWRAWRPAEPAEHRPQTRVASSHPTTQGG